MRAEEFERLYVAEAPTSSRSSPTGSGDRALAEDLLADTFERALRARKRSTAAGRREDVAVRDRVKCPARPRPPDRRRGAGAERAARPGGEIDPLAAVHQRDGSAARWPS